ncbi:MAG: hypothetical protein HYS98_00545 [Deltaproteobacteria bacterium]|nr:hypothetical protein [Deltaproteobacteria bacterium]
MSAQQFKELEKLLKVYRKQPRSKIFAPLAEAYRRNGLVEEALALCEKGLSFFPDYAGGKVAYARSLMDAADFSRARMILEETVSFNPQNLLAHRLLKKCYEKLNLSKEAAEIQKRITFLNPYDLSVVEDTKPQREDSPFEGFELKSLKSALSVTERSNEEKNNTQKNYVTLSFAQLYEKQGLLQKALEVYEALTKKEPENQLIQTKCQELLKRIGDPSPAARDDKGKAEDEKVSILKKVLSGIQKSSEI